MALDELRTLLDRHARDDMTTPIYDVLISKVERMHQPSPSMTGTVLAVIAQGSKQLALGDQIYVYGPGQYLIASVDMPVTGHYFDIEPSRPSLGFGLVLRPTLIAEVLLSATPSDIPSTTARTPRGLTVNDADEGLLDAVLRMVRLLETPQDAAVLAPLIKREIIWRVLSRADGASLLQLGLADSNLNYIARVVEWIRDNYAHSFRVDDLASMANMSASAFHRNFQSVTGMSPIQFQKQIRLQQARLLLASGSGDVTTIGISVGYESPSQFSREYRRQFGTPPSQDAALLRAAQ